MPKITKHKRTICYEFLSKVNKAVTLTTAVTTSDKFEQILNSQKCM